VVDADAALGAEHTRDLVAAVGDTVRPVILRLSFFTGMDIPKALPDWRWHSLQWQASKRIGSVVTT
jgi:hypothetical protein